MLMSVAHPRGQPNMTMPSSPAQQHRPIGQRLSHRDTIHHSRRSPDARQSSAHVPAAAHFQDPVTSHHPAVLVCANKPRTTRSAPSTHEQPSMTQNRTLESTPATPMRDPHTASMVRTHGRPWKDSASDTSKGIRRRVIGVAEEQGRSRNRELRRVHDVIK
ncbi:unnamed protein product [Pleuronectes platessa]|uniref:Uncharacterized protein n=1 Tax=Pleuronectes platessa TaxID=8262 RepID=A0A9N7YEX7_PLEPL|nr:unnamed protein product [Pleuronectes platessa]